MTQMDWRTVQLDAGVLREPAPDAGRIIVWVAGKMDNGYRHWQRIANVPGAGIVAEHGIRCTQATSMPARQKIRGLIGKVVDWLGKSASPSSWVLPSGGRAEQTGERQTGLLLAWAEDEVTGLNEDRLRARWQEGQRFRQIGRNLFMVYPPQPGQVARARVPALLERAREQAEQLLSAARQAGNRRAEAVALTDSGIALTRSGDFEKATIALEEAAALGRDLSDRSLENDALSNLAMALLAVGQTDRALELLEKALAYARETGERFEEKIVLTHLGTVRAARSEHGEALTAAGQALSLARELGDRSHEADLLWFQALQQADLGQVEQAAALAQAAIDVHATLRSPHVAWLTSLLKRYRPIVPPAPPAPRSYYTGSGSSAVQAPPTPVAASDPGLLRAAMSAVKTMENSTDSGMKTVPQATWEKRLEVCAPCPHHTGMRCKLCGQFTTVKAWLTYEQCPIGKWSR